MCLCIFQSGLTGASKQKPKVLQELVLEWLDGEKYLRIWKTKQKYQYYNVRKISTAQLSMVQRVLNVFVVIHGA